MQDPQHKRPLWIGGLLASIAPSLCMSALLFFSSTGNPSLIDVVLVVGVSLPVAFLAMFTLGLPYILWLRSRHMLNSLLVCAGAVVIGVLAMVLFRLALSGDLLVPNKIQLLYGSGFGLVAGIAFCIGAGPNNSFKPKPLRGSA